MNSMTVLVKILGAKLETKITTGCSINKIMWKRKLMLTICTAKVNPLNKQKKVITENNTNLSNGVYGEVKMLENDIYNEQLPEGTENIRENKDAHKSGKSKAVETDLSCTGTYSEVKMQRNV